MQHLERHIEALIFASEQPIQLAEIKASLDATFETEFPTETILEAVELLKTRYAEEAFAIEPIHIAGGYQFLTKAAYHHVVGNYLRQSAKKRLSQAALETLSIIAYKQPTSKGEVEQIRGVNCDYSIQKLLEKELIEIKGRSEGPGRPLLYGTSPKFMNYFGINTLNDLPRPKDFKEPESEIGGDVTI